MANTLLADDTAQDPSADKPAQSGGNAKPIKTRKELHLQRWYALKSERSSWIREWKEISEVLLPRAGRFFVEDRNRGNRRNQKIFDSTATKSLRVLGAGLMAGATSPARPWIALKTPYRELNKKQAVKVWCAEVTKLILDVFNRSNVYRSLHSMYEEIGAFGTAVSIIMQDFNDVIRMYPLTAGEYAISTNDKGEVDTLYREFQLTVAQLVKKFGYENCSENARRMYDSGNLDVWRTVLHIIEPNEDRDPSKSDARNMAWTSTYLELGGSSDSQQTSNQATTGGDNATLSVSGFKKFRVVAPRWATFGGDIYGSGPASDALGDIRQLQHEQLRKGQAIDKMTNPPLQAPTSLKNHDFDGLPGGLSYVDSATPQGGIRTLYDVNLRLDYLLQDIQDVRQRIKSAFYEDLFLMLANNVNSNMTATEVAELHEEKMLMLGPVIERLHDELLKPLVDAAFDILAEAGLLPPPPPDLQGMTLQVEFISILAQAMKQIGTNSIDKFVMALGGIATMQINAGQQPTVMDNFDTDGWYETYADAQGVDPAINVDPDERDQARAARAKAQQQAQQQAQMQQAAETAKTAAQAPTQGGASNVLSDVMSNLTGYTQ
ncbi:Bacteriophage head to tail connecting protein [Caballeronia arvi]|uniref:Bacteriophage head to tail connecting protein n=1 Tax=Caballeronia arvi TaxID=1777135 RepID=A0A158HTU7_9BURK|nr:portal protein [Caballeronia arvi]SAL47389.1 Bacteriophage head to tail connecting protein [Caballeronia arvi]